MDPLRSERVKMIFPILTFVTFQPAITTAICTLSGTHSSILLAVNLVDHAELAGQRLTMPKKMRRTGPNSHPRRLKALGRERIPAPMITVIR